MFKFKKFFLGFAVNCLFIFFLSAAFISEAAAAVWDFNDLKSAYAAGGNQSGEISGILNFTSDLDPVPGVGNALSMTLIGANGTFGDLDGNGYRGFNLTSSSRLLELKNLRLNGMNGAVRANSENLIFENVSFNNNVLNIASQHGGAIFTYGTDTAFKGVSTAFYNNSTSYGLGGAIAAAGNSSLSFSAAHTIFDGNTATQAGGAIFLDGSSATFNAGVNFIDNISFNSFGGAIYTNKYALLTFNSAVDFKRNKATNSGGAIYLERSRAFFNYKTLFESNASTQTSGGAMYLTNYSTVTIGRTADFTANQAKLEGGAIYLEGNSALVSASGSSITFTGNYSSSTFGGGAIYMNGASLDFLSGSSLKFSENKAYGRGGALTIYDSTASFGASNTEFSKNSAVLESGGAVYIRDGSTVTFSGNTVFSTNTAGATGGAIASIISKLEFDASSQVNFYGNSAVNAGGAVLLNNADAFFNSKTLFEKNIAQSQDGGAIRAHTNSNLYFDGATRFIENTAATYGGAISLLQSTASFNAVSTYFTGNIAQSSGGAVYMSGSVLNINDGFSASYNMANGAPNDIYMDVNSDLNLTGNNEISFNSGIVSASTTNVINKTGNGTLFLGGNNDIKAQFNITGGSVVVRDGNFNYANNNSAININSAASMVFNAGSTVLFSSNTSGSITLDSGNAVFNGSAVFSYNDSTNTNDYGMFYANNGSVVRFNDADMKFINNEEYGVMTLSGDTVLEIAGGKTLFQGNNNNTQLAGALTVYASKIKYTGRGISELRFSNNTAAYFGGALRLGTGNAEFDGVVVFEDNHSKQTGGAIYASNNANFENLGTTLFSGNIASGIGGGGAVSSDGSSDFRFGSFTGFSNNISSTVGGAVNLKSSSKMYFSGEANFSSNTAVTYGGAIHLDGASGSPTLEFNGNNSNYLFMSNKAGENGGAIAAGGRARVFFEAGSLAEFNDNSAAESGGAIFITGYSNLIFDGESKFKDNEVIGSGGAVYANNSYAFFKKTEFDGNTSNSDGGAVYGLNSSLSFDGETVFKNNKASSSGAGLFLSASTASFSTTVTFENNASTMTGSLGGAIASVNNSLVTFANTVNITGNSADSGAGFSMSDSQGRFSGTANFSNNTSSAGNGGAMSLENSVMKFNENVNFSSNSAISGAGISATGADINFAKDSDFSFNKALSGNGGAANLSNSNITFNGGDVLNNSASSKGGAFYVNASTLSITTNNRDFTATDNTAGSLANDIYMESGSFLNLKASNYAISLNGGIISQNSTINKNGAHTLYLGGTNDIDGGSFNISEGKVVMLENASLDVEKMSIAADGSFASNGIGNVNFDNFDFSGEWIVTVSSDSSDKIIADKITVNNAKIGVSGEKLKGTFAYTIMEYSSMAVGNIQVENTLKSALNITDTGTSLEMTVTNMNFADIKGINENSKNVSVILDSVYEDYYIQQNNFWKNIIVPIDNIASLSDMNKALDALSGSFIANALTVGSLNIGKPALFSRINTGTEKDIWAEITGGSFGYSEDDNVVGDFKGTNYGIMIGADLLKKENLTAGALVKYTGSSIEQNDDSGDITDISLGGYAGLTFGAIELKGALQLGYQSYELERKLEFAGQTAKGDFNGFGVLFDIEAGFNMSLTEKINAKPFVALGLGMNTNESYTESGSDANLDVDSGSYMRTRAELGIEVGTQIEKLSLYGDLALGMLLSGNNGEIKAKLEGKEITAKGTEQGEIGGRIGIGGRYEITESLGIYAKAGFKLASNYNDISGNVGVGYKIGK